MLKSLNKKQLQIMEETRNFWIDFLFSCKHTTDQVKAKTLIIWLYELCGLKAPQIFFVASPMAAKQKYKELGGTETNVFCQYGSIYDYGWTAFYDFFDKIGVIADENFRKFRDLLLTAIYDMIQLEDYCIVSDMPDFISRDNEFKLHNETRSAIHFRDGYELFFWHGINVPEMWIKHPEKIKQSDILGEKNIEKRKCIRQILGAERYFGCFGGVVLLDEDNDAYKNPMKLYETKKEDQLTGKKIQFLEVICPSTGRMYNLYPTRRCSNVFEAKASTFSDAKIEIRHGDVGLLNLNKEFDRPVQES